MLIDNIRYFEDCGSPSLGGRKKIHARSVAKSALFYDQWAALHIAVRGAIPNWLKAPHLRHVNRMNAKQRRALARSHSRWEDIPF